MDDYTNIPVVSYSPYLKGAVKRQKISVAPRVLPGGYSVLRPLQVRAYWQLIDKHHGLCIMPTGSGKTWVVAAVIGERLLQPKNRKHRVIIIVPQKGIGNGFCQSIRVKTPSGVKVNFLPKHNLCEEMQIGSSPIESLYSFLTNPRNGSDINDRIAVCTHMTFNAVLEEILESGDTNYLNDLTIVIDEAHHSACDDEVGSNSLGWITETIMTKSPSCRIFMTTATPFRHDGRPLLPEKCLKMMEDGTHYVPLD